tara:strand:- start:81 stop:608 length:528 start_codon:yes stop_codon:yes gene_type:complete
MPGGGYDVGYGPPQIAAQQMSLIAQGGKFMKNPGGGMRRMPVLPGEEGRENEPATSDLTYGRIRNKDSYTPEQQQQHSAEFEAGAQRGADMRAYAAKSPEEKERNESEFRTFQKELRGGFQIPRRKYEPVEGAIESGGMQTRGYETPLERMDSRYKKDFMNPVTGKLRKYSKKEY